MQVAGPFGSGHLCFYVDSVSDDLQLGAPERRELPRSREAGGARWMQVVRRRKLVFEYG